MEKLRDSALNFGSDVNLMYVFGSAEGVTTGPSNKALTSQVSNTEYFRHLSQEITNAMREVSEARYIFRVDLNLRPEGKDGDIATSINAYKHYHSTRGKSWERLALLKTRPFAGGGLALGQRVFSSIASFVHGPPFAGAGLEELKAIKGRIDKKLATRQPENKTSSLGSAAFA